MKPAPTCVLVALVAPPYLKWGMTCLPISLMESMMRVWDRLPGCTKHSTWSTPASWYFFITSMTSSGVPMAKAPESMWSWAVLSARSVWTASTANL